MTPAQRGEGLAGCVADRMRLTAAVASLLAITNCGQPSGSLSQSNASAQGRSVTADARPRGQPGANPAQDMIVDMTAADRNRMFGRFMRSGRERCSRVTRSFYQGGTPAGEVFWDVSCADNGDWQVMIEPDSTGSTRIECSVIAAITPRARCWRPFDS
jgi:hypothetical protein